MASAAVVQDEADLDISERAARRRNTAGVVPAGAAGCSPLGGGLAL